MYYVCFHVSRLIIFVLKSWVCVKSRNMFFCSVRKQEVIEIWFDFGFDVFTLASKKKKLYRTQVASWLYSIFVCYWILVWEVFLVVTRTAYSHLGIISQCVPNCIVLCDSLNKANPCTHMLYVFSPILTHSIFHYLSIFASDSRQHSETAKNCL